MNQDGQPLVGTCVVCDGNIPIRMNMQQSAKTPWGEFTAYFHKECYTASMPKPGNDKERIEGKDIVAAVLKSMAESARPK